MKKFKWRYVSKADYDSVLVGWWNAWGFPVPVVECLPERGIIVSDGEGDLYGGFLYLTDGGIGWMEWVVSDKDAAVERKRGALEFLTDVLTGMAKDEGMLMVFTSTVLPGFANGLKKCGFRDGDRGVYQFIKFI